MGKKKEFSISKILEMENEFQDFINLFMKKKKFNISEKLARENEFQDFINLYLEGGSWTACQQSVFKILHCYQNNSDLLYCYTEGLSISAMYFRAVGRDVISVRFPKGSLHRFFNPDKIEWLSDSHVRMPCPSPDESECKEWFAQLSNQSSGGKYGDGVVMERNLRACNSLAELVFKTIDVDSRLSRDYRRMLDANAEARNGFGGLLRRIHYGTNSLEERKDIWDQANEQVGVLKSRMKELLKMNRIGQRLCAAVCDQADSFLEQLSVWQKEGTPLSAPASSPQTGAGDSIQKEESAD
ncbi:MAG: hypothetical protein LBR26_10995 [Prevotella sp.]|jgi:hypothetical protein|nr:hypothetical protein [Prevotella sp.]